MKRIAVLIDLTPIGHKALEFAGKLAAESEAELVLVHVAATHVEEEQKNLVAKLNELRADLPKELEVLNHLVSGNFETIIPTVIVDLQPDLVLVATHGKVGFKQHLFGSNILKLVQSVHVPVLVVQEQSEYPKAGFKKLLFPVGPNADIDVKYKQIATFARAFGSRVTMYNVRNDVRGLPEEILANIQTTSEYFKNAGVAYDVLIEEPVKFSVGYAKHILHQATSGGTDAICIMSRITDDNQYIGTRDKENILLNEAGIAVLCSN